MSTWRILRTAGRDTTPLGYSALVVVEPRMIQDLFPNQDPERIRQLQVLDEEVVLGLQVRPRHGRLEVEGQPLLDAGEARALGQVEEEEQIQDDRRRENGVAAEE